MTQDKRSVTCEIREADMLHVGTGHQDGVLMGTASSVIIMDPPDMFIRHNSIKEWIDNVQYRYLMEKIH